MNYLYPFLFLARIVMFCATIAFWDKDGFVQMLILAAINCFMLGFVAAYKPFKHRLRNQLAIINETTLVTATMTLFPFTYSEISETLFHKAALICGAFVLTLILITLLVGVIYMVVIFC